MGILCARQYETMVSSNHLEFIQSKKVSTEPCWAPWQSPSMSTKHESGIPFLAFACWHYFCQWPAGSVEHGMSRRQSFLFKICLLLWNTHFPLKHVVIHMEGRGSLCMLTLEMKKKCVRTRGIILGGNRELLTSETSSDRTWIYYFSVTRHSQLVFGRVICFETHLHMFRIVFASDSESSDCGVSFCLKLCRGSKWTLKSLLDF